MITVFGSINMDLIATTARLPKPGETVTGNSFTTAAGGKGANQALAATRAGASVRMAGAVGWDSFAESALGLMKEAGTDLSLVKTASEPTGTAHILVGGDGENVIVVVSSANETVNEADALAAIETMTPQDTLVLQLEVPAAAVEGALLAARERGVRSIINIAPLTEHAAALGRMADIVVANETEFERLAGRDRLSPEERQSAIQALSAETGQTVIVTLGADGVIAMHEGEMYTAAGLVIEPIDTVGAGDTFCGYLAAGLDAGLSFEKALRRAAVAGSLACLKPGAQPAIPLASMVDAAL
ncbi:ribokinase [Rhizobium sp. Leaf384]|uniref:ribokinase n=1 Tax=unclassified Rhizobium TaxID=2613769 RepID=UPI000712FA89|nr:MULTISPECIES: ribokinase [unclassified Rhizobium]KQS81125.1 ribokinase [Rhizobium sp. Leaf384]KQS87033.1 ribokinase [Rhizobium sp. Leaf383]